MQNERLEFFKLDPTDRKVLFWLMDNVDLKSLRDWMEFIAGDYRQKGCRDRCGETRRNTTEGMVTGGLMPD